MILFEIGCGLKTKIKCKQKNLLIYCRNIKLCISKVIFDLPGMFSATFVTLEIIRMSLSLQNVYHNCKLLFHENVKIRNLVQVVEKTALCCNVSAGFARKHWTKLKRGRIALFIDSTGLLIPDWKIGLDARRYCSVVQIRTQNFTYFEMNVRTVRTKIIQREWSCGRFE